VCRFGGVFFGRQTGDKGARLGDFGQVGVETEGGAAGGRIDEKGARVGTHMYITTHINLHLCAGA